MVLFIDVTLINPANGDLVKKRLTCPGDVSESYVASAVASFAKALPGMVDDAKKKVSNQ
jgi:hypothetical protein